MRRVTSGILTTVVAVALTTAANAQELRFADGLGSDDGQGEVTPSGFACDDACCSDAYGCSDDAGCCDVCGCGDLCGDACGCIHSHCLENCGLLGHGLATFDPCGEGCDAVNLLLGIFQPTECGFEDFISPTTNPVFFEDPRLLTEARGLFLNHKLPIATGGGDVQLYALQLRGRLTDRLAFIASRDGYVVSQNPLVGDGFADIDVGFKYALYRDVKNQRLLSAGVVYDLPVGTPDTLQGLGDGEFHLFLTGGAEFLDHGHWISGFGGKIPVDGGANSSFLYWSNHFDYQFRRGWYAFTEFNWFHYTDGGDDALGLTGIEGFDLINLGSGGVDGNDIVSGAFGLTYTANPKTQYSVAWELPLSGRRDILENRINVNVIYRY